jgi:hypothetical protein
MDFDSFSDSFDRAIDCQIQIDDSHTLFVWKADKKAFFSSFFFGLAGAVSRDSLNLGCDTLSQSYSLGRSGFLFSGDGSHAIRIRPVVNQKMSLDP